MPTNATIDFCISCCSRGFIKLKCCLETLGSPIFLCASTLTFSMEWSKAEHTRSPPGLCCWRGPWFHGWIWGQPRGATSPSRQPLEGIFLVEIKMYLNAKTLAWTAPSFLLSTENLFLSNGLSFFFFNLATERQYKMQKKGYFRCQA